MYMHKLQGDNLFIYCFFEMKVQSIFIPIQTNYPLGVDERVALTVTSFYLVGFFASKNAESRREST